MVKIIRKYDMDYNVFMKLGRTLKYKLTVCNGNEKWKIRSRMMWTNYWKKYIVKTRFI
jgi:hypothetical protein